MGGVGDMGANEFVTVNPTEPSYAEGGTQHAGHVPPAEGANQDSQQQAFLLY
jgi:hypothetical protein